MLSIGGLCLLVEWKDRQFGSILVVGLDLCGGNPPNSKKDCCRRDTLGLRDFLKVVYIIKGVPKNIYLSITYLEPL